MLKFTKDILLPLLPLTSIMFVAGCNPPSSAPPFPTTYDRNERSLSNAAVTLAGKIYRETGNPAKIHVIDNDSSFEGLFLGVCDWSPVCAYEFTDVNPDLIVRMETVGTNDVAVWSEDQTTSGYYPVHTRLGFNSNSAPYSQNAWRQIELTESLKSNSYFDRYFPEESPIGGLEPTRVAIAGHLRFFIDHQDLFRLMADNIEAQAADYVFMLGDFNRSDKLYEYINIESNFMARMPSTTNAGKTVYLPGNHEMRNIHLKNNVPGYTAGLFYKRYPDPYYAEFAADGAVIPENPELIQTTTLNIVPIHSGGDSKETMSNRMNAARDLMTDPSLPTMVLSAQRVWTTWHWTQDWLMPYFKSWDIMPLLTFLESDGKTPREPVVRADVMIDGDSQDEIQTGVLNYWDRLPWASVGMDAQIYFSVVTMGQDDHILRIRPFYLDLPAGHQYYKDTH